MIYFFPIIVFVLLTLRNTLVRHKEFNISSMFFFHMILTYLLIIACIRNGMGDDFYAYESIFKGVDTLNDYNYLELGFRSIIVFLKNIDVPIHFIFSFFALITLVPLFYIFPTYSVDPLMSLFVYYLSFYLVYVFNGIRQGIVMTFFLASIGYIEKKETKKLAFITLFATLFHYSGIFIFLAYLFSRLEFSHFKTKKETFLLQLSSILLIGILSSKVYLKLIQMSPNFIRSKLLNYLTKFPNSISISSVLLRFLIIIPVIIYYESLLKNTFFKINFKLYMVGIIFYSLLSFNSMLATRVNMFFRVLEVFMIPYLISAPRSYKQRLFLYTYYVSIYLLVFLKTVSSPHYLPYVSIFS